MNRPPDDFPELPELAGLAPEADVSPLEEERTVRALRAEGLLREPRARPLRWVRLTLQLAAALALFAAGIAVGDGLAHHPGASGPSAAGDTTGSNDAVLAIQQTGSSFVRAISRVPAPPATDPRALAAAHEVARATLRAAEALLERNPPPSAPEGGPHVVWF